MAATPVRVAIVGLGFGAEFIPIFQRHPNAEMVAICQRTRSKLDEVGDRYDVEKRFTDYREMLEDTDIDAVHINSPIPDHAWMSIAALNAGKHVACTVPMGTTIDELKQIVAAKRKSGKYYTMMETVVYAREYLFVKELYDKGELGRIQFLRGSHQQDMDGWPDYWPGLPPMHYATHCVSPCLALLGKHAKSVVCHGSGHIREELIENYGSPFSYETATITIEDSDVVAEVTRSLFDTARQYRESFDAYGSKRSFEWQQVEGEAPVIHTKSTVENPISEPEIAQRTEVPDYASRLPKEIAPFTRQGVYGGDEGDEHLSFTQGGGHGGSHPHLSHQFIDAIIEGREPFPDAETSANWTAVGICAHESAMNGGIRVDIPKF